MKNERPAKNGALGRAGVAFPSSDYPPCVADRKLSELDDFELVAAFVGSELTTEPTARDAIVSSFPVLEPAEPA